MAVGVQHDTVCGCKLSGGCLVPQHRSSFDTEGEFAAKHFRQTRCANFVARLVSQSFAELDSSFGTRWASTLGRLALVWAEWVHAGQGTWPERLARTSAAVFSAPSARVSLRGGA